MSSRAVRYLAGFPSEKPGIGRFGYVEKMEYWAVVWGTIIMGATGLMTWFKIDVTDFLLRWVVTVVTVVTTNHYYEAVLACLAIVVWHFYHAIFDPAVYPLNTAFLDGRTSEGLQAHEHPLEYASEGSARSTTILHKNIYIKINKKNG